MNNLYVYLYGIFAGKITRKDSGELSFKYNDEYLQLKTARPLSVSMPLTEQVYENEISLPFFSGYLPDGEALKQLAVGLNCSKEDLISMLAAVGSDCAGAISFFPVEINQNTRMPDKDLILDDDNLYNILLMVNNRSLLPIYKNLNHILPGSQYKIAVNIKENQIILPNGNNLTSHILKFPLMDRQHSLQNELFCMRLAECLGFNTPKYNLKYCKSLPYLLITRYDRLISDDDVTIRLHQENFCQSMSVLPENKADTKGGPAITDCLRLIEAHAKQPASDKLLFIRLVIFNYLIGNSDTSAKSFSFLYNNDKISLAPVSNLLSNCIYAKLSPKMNMSIDDKFYPNLVRQNHWHSIVSDNSTARNMINKELHKMSTIIPDKAVKLQSILNQEGINSDIFNHIISLIIKRAKHLSRYSENTEKTNESRIHYSKNTSDKFNESLDSDDLSTSMTIDMNDKLHYNEPVMSKSTFNNVIKPDENITPISASSFETIEKLDSNKPVIPKSTFDKINKSKDTSIPFSASSFETIEKLDSNKPAIPKMTFDKISKSEENTSIMPDYSTDIIEKSDYNISINPKNTFDKLNELDETQYNKPARTFDRKDKLYKEKTISPKSTFNKLNEIVDIENTTNKKSADNHINSKSSFDSVKEMENTQNNRPASSFNNNDKLKNNKYENTKTTFDKLNDLADKENIDTETPYDTIDKSDNKKSINPKSTFDKLFKNE